MQYEYVSKCVYIIMMGSCSCIWNSVVLQVPVMNNLEYWLKCMHGCVSLVKPSKKRASVFLAWQDKQTQDICVVEHLMTPSAGVGS